MIETVSQEVLEATASSSYMEEVGQTISAEFADVYEALITR